MSDEPSTSLDPDNAYDVISKLFHVEKERVPLSRRRSAAPKVDEDDEDYADVDEVKKKRGRKSTTLPSPVQRESQGLVATRKCKVRGCRGLLDSGRHLRDLSKCTAFRPETCENTRCPCWSTINCQSLRIVRTNCALSALWIELTVPVHEIRQIIENGLPTGSADNWKICSTHFVKDFLYPVIGLNIPRERVEAILSRYGVPLPPNLDDLNDFKLGDPTSGRNRKAFMGLIEDPLKDISAYLKKDGFHYSETSNQIYEMEGNLQWPWALKRGPKPGRAAAAAAAAMYSSDSEEEMEVVKVTSGQWQPLRSKEGLPELYPPGGMLIEKDAVLSCSVEGCVQTEATAQLFPFPMSTRNAIMWSVQCGSDLQGQNKVLQQYIKLYYAARDRELKFCPLNIPLRVCHNHFEDEHGPSGSHPIPTLELPSIKEASEEDVLDGMADRIFILTAHPQFEIPSVIRVNFAPDKLLKRPCFMRCGIAGCVNTNLNLFPSAQRLLRLFPVPYKPSERDLWHLILEDNNVKVTMEEVNRLAETGGFVCETHFKGFNPRTAYDKLPSAKKPIRLTVKPPPVPILPKVTVPSAPGADGWPMLNRAAFTQPVKCMVPSCVITTLSTQPGSNRWYKFYQLPVDPKLLDKWFWALRSANQRFQKPEVVLPTHCICERHFMGNTPQGGAPPTRFLKIVIPTANSTAASQLCFMTGPNRLVQQTEEEDNQCCLERSRMQALLNRLDSRATGLYAELVDLFGVLGLPVPQETEVYVDSEDDRHVWVEKGEGQESEEKGEGEEKRDRDLAYLLNLDRNIGVISDNVKKIGGGQQAPATDAVPSTKAEVVIEEVEVKEEEEENSDDVKQLSPAELLEQLVQTAVPGQKIEGEIGADKPEDEDDQILMEEMEDEGEEGGEAGEPRDDSPPPLFIETHDDMEEEEEMEE